VGNVLFIAPKIISVAITLRFPRLVGWIDWTSVLILVSKNSATAMMYRPIQLRDGLFQLSTFRGAGNVYAKLQATKIAQQTAQLKQ